MEAAVRAWGKGIVYLCLVPILHPCMDRALLTVCPYPAVLASSRRGTVVDLDRPLV